MPDGPLEIVDLRDRDSGDEALLKEIIGGLYEESFPNEDEREDLHFWQTNLWGKANRGAPVVHFLVARAAAPDSDASVAGFIATEYYRKAQVGLITYVGVVGRSRGRGVGRTLIDAAYRTLEADARADSASLRAVLAEIHEPTRIEFKDSIAPRARVAVMARYGARRIPIPYVQPRLDSGGDRAYGLMLVAFPASRRDFLEKQPATTVPAEPIREFLHELYSASEQTSREAQEQDGDVVRMLNALHGDVELDDLVECEDPVPALPLDRYAIAFHLVVSPPADTGPAAPPEPSGVEIDSFERDMLAYAYRDSRPFTTQVDVLPTLRRLRVHFPPQVSFVTEGRPVTLLRNGPANDDGVRVVDLRVARTDFPSGFSILHLVLRPPADPAGSALNEYEVIKLAKFWEGGENVPDPAERRGDNPLFTISRECDGRRSRKATLRVIARKTAAGRGTVQSMRAGTIQILVDDKDCRRLCDAMRKLRKDEGAARLDDDTRRKITAVGGMLQGLLDFREIDLDELADVFKDVEPETSRIDSIKKGTLFSLTHEDRGFVSAEALGVSPYLLIPQTVLLHNEALLQRALAIEKAEEEARGLSLEAAWKASKRQGTGADEMAWWWRRWRAAQVWAANRLHHRLARTEDERRRIAGLLNSLVPNVFHYEAEQRLYERGWESRGLESLKNEVESRLAELGTDIDKRHSRLRDIAAQTIALLLLVFTAVQAVDYLPTWIVVAVSIVTALVYLSLILRR